MRSAWLLGVVSCTRRTHSLSELPDVEVHLSAAHPVDEQDGMDAPAHVIVDVAYSVETFRAGHAAECATFQDIDGEYATLEDEHSTSATFDDVYMELTDPGGDDDTGNCRPPRFELDWLPASVHEADVELAVGDDRTVVLAEFYRSMLNARHATLLSHERWAFAPGDTVTLAWSHVADTAGEDFEIWLEGGDPIRIATVPAVDAELSFEVPSPAPLASGMLVTVIEPMHTQTGAASRCQGATRCRWDVPMGYRHQVVIE